MYRACRFWGSDVAGREPWHIDVSTYDRLLDLPYSGWSWEYKRRDAALRAARNASRNNVAMMLRDDGSHLYRLKSRDINAEAFGLHFIPDPNLSAFEATPFWLPEIMSTNLEAASEISERIERRATPLRWDEIPGEKHFLIAPGRRPKLVINAPGYAAQLAIEENALPVPQAIYMSLRLGAGHLLNDHLRHVEDFADFCLGRDVSCKPLRGFSPEKLKDALIALDGHLAGVSQRAIAETIFGAEIVRQDWDQGPRSYKSKTRRLIKKGITLMETGYRDLL